MRIRRQRIKNPRDPPTPPDEAQVREVRGGDGLEGVCQSPHLGVERWNCHEFVGNSGCSLKWILRHRVVLLKKARRRGPGNFKGSDDKGPQ